MNISKKMFNPSKPRSDQPKNSLNNNTAESFFWIVRIKEMITNLKSSDYYRILRISTKGNV